MEFLMQPISRCIVYSRFLFFQNAILVLMDVLQAEDWSSSTLPDTVLFAHVCVQELVMDDLRFQRPPDGSLYEIRFLHIPGALLTVACGLILDALMFTIIAIYKCPVMLFKWWKCLIKDLIGGEDFKWTTTYGCI
uniref:Uncharacterized protein n=1 Tax=Aegilops tauschii TaxID=37682 RepID=M8BR75_AEGTA